MHYVASIKVEKVDSSATPPKRQVDTVTQITIKADSMPKLIEKIGKHVEIIEEN